MRTTDQDGPDEPALLAAGQLRALVERSRGLGADADLVVHGGGNTSSKIVETDHLGRRRRVLRVKGSGSDLATVTTADFPGLFLDELLPLRERTSMDDEEMTAYLLRCVNGAPGGPRPSIETLLHAFIPATHVDHVHADAICALTNTPDGAEQVRAALGSDVALIPWLRPGFALSRLVAEAVPGCTAVVLAHHGLVTWGETGEESVARTQELVASAERHLRDRGARRTVIGAAVSPPADVPALLLRLRGRLSRDQRQVLHVDPEGRRVTDRRDVRQLAEAGPATADHMLRTRPWAAVVTDADEADRAVDAVDAVVERYEAYWRRHAGRAPGAMMRNPNPSVVLVPGLGTVTAGGSEQAARVVADCAWHTLRVAADVLDAFGELDRLSEEDMFDVDYWPLELAKLGRAARRELDGHVLVVTGAASGIGRDVAVDLAGRGAHLVLADLDGEGLERLAADLAGRGVPRPELVVGDLCDEAVADDVVDAAVRRFGGLDGAVSNAGIGAPGSLTQLTPREWRRSLEVNTTAHFLLTRRMIEALRTQGIGGSLVYVASKNAFAPGADFGAYSAAKAAQVQLARVAAIEGGQFGIRANVVNPDAVFQGSRLWSPELRASRAAAHAVAVDDLESFYAGRNLLHARVTGEHVAQAVAFLLSDRASRTTGCVLTVDGGVTGAFPR